MIKYSFGLFICLFLFTSCKDDDVSDDGMQLSTKQLKIKFRFDENQTRLNSFGNPAQIPVNHAAQSPQFNQLSVHLIELVPNEFTPYKGGAIIFEGETVAASNPNPFGFNTAVDFEKAIVVAENEIFLEYPIDEISTGMYSHIRVSVTYQNYDVVFNLNNISGIDDLENQSGTLASFLGYNMYINQVVVGTQTLDVQDFKLQGFWGFETNLSPPFDNFNTLVSGQAPESQTTVVNPFPSSPIPQGSCVVSGSMNNPLIITGQETEDLTLVLSFSINKSFEWEDDNANGKWDIDASQPANSEKIVDMGLRGLVGFLE